ncbi:MAG: ATP-binding protein [Oscillatoria princeps RMCB-10]|nr:ATP-binding protein [Oscillatoria princeps RMCB-10]
MTQIIGDFREDILAKHQLLMVDFFLHSIPLNRRKQTRYLSIAFLSDFLANIFPLKEDNIKKFEKQLHLKTAVSYIANELLENSIKFHEYAGSQPIKLGVGSTDQLLVFVSVNCVSETTLGKFKEFAHQLATSDADELYFRQLEKGAEEKSEESGLGLLSLLNDYSAKLGWKIETVSKDPAITTLTTMVLLTAQ